MVGYLWYTNVAQIRKLRGAFSHVFCFKFEVELVDKGVPQVIEDPPKIIIRMHPSNQAYQNTQNPHVAEKPAVRRCKM